MKKLAVLCPSRNRPEGLKSAYESWKTNSVQSDIFFCFQDNDDSLNVNIKIVEGHSYIIESDIGLAAKANKLCDLNPGYDAYMVLNDDQIIQTNRWDGILLDELVQLEESNGHRLWILHWRDGIQDQKLCQGFVTKEMLAITGSFFPRNYMRHLYIDNYFMFIGESCGILKYIPEVFIEHLHYSVGKSPLDASYMQTNSLEALARDGAAYRKWVNEQGLEIVSKINRIKAGLTKE